MSVRFEIRMTPQAMYSFMLHHNYTQLSGILEVVFGTVILATGLKQAESGKTRTPGRIFSGRFPQGRRLCCIWIKAVPLSFQEIRSERNGRLQRR